MDYRRLGRSALRVSPVCLGTMNFGPLTTEPDAHKIMDRALELGINFFDTANRYGGEKGAGTTEKILGTWFAQGGGRRDKVVLATKVFGPMTDWPNDGLLSARHIIQSCEASLTRMQTDYIDLFQMHHIDRGAPWDEVWQAFETLVAARQDRLRGQQQLRGLAHRPGERSGEVPQLPRTRERTEPVQPRGAHGRARSAPRMPVIWRRCHSVESARGRHARRIEQRHRTPEVDPAALREDAPADRAVGEALRGAR